MRGGWNEWEGTANRLENGLVGDVNYFSVGKENKGMCAELFCGKADIVNGL